MAASDSRKSSLLVSITSLRIALVPAVIGLIQVAPDSSSAEAAAAVVFSIAAVTDFVDGRLARHWGVTSTLGNFLDTTADKLLASGALIALVSIHRTSPWIVVVIVGRELVILALRGVVASEGAIVKPSLAGKAKTNVQFLAILLAILRYGDRLGPLYLDEWAMAAAAIITVMSGFEYLARFSSAFATWERRG